MRRGSTRWRARCAGVGHGRSSWDELLTDAGVGSDALLELLELLDRHEHGPGLRTLGRTHDALALEEVHEAAGTREPDPQLALQHARRAEPAANHELHRLGEEVVVLVDLATGTAAGRVLTRDALDVRRLGDLAPPVRDEAPDALLVDPR